MASIEMPVMGTQSAAISNLVVRITRDYTGRGPTRARTHFNGDVVTVVLQDTLTKAERTLAGNGHGELVLSARRVLRTAMRGDLLAGVQELLGREVVADLSATNLDPDIAVETFILAPAAIGDQDPAR